VGGRGGHRISGGDRWGVRRILDDDLTPQNGIFEICVSFDQKEGWEGGKKNLTHKRVGKKPSTQSRHPKAREGKNLAHRAGTRRRGREKNLTPEQSLKGGGGKKHNARAIRSKAGVGKSYHLSRSQK
jgi:hypothetical protein